MAFIVTTLESAKQLEDYIGRIVVPNLDNAELEFLIIEGDTIISGGGLYTLIYTGVPSNMKVLAKGVYYTVIEEV